MYVQHLKCVLCRLALVVYVLKEHAMQCRHMQMGHVENSSMLLRVLPAIGLVSSRTNMVFLSAALSLPYI